MAEGGVDPRMGQITFESDTFKFVTDMIIYMLHQRDIVWIPRERMVGLVDYFGVEIARILLPLARHYREEFEEIFEQVSQDLFMTDEHFNMFLWTFNFSLFREDFRWIKFSSLLAFGSELAYFCVASNQWRFVDILARNLAVVIVTTHEEALGENGRWAGYLDYCAVRCQEEHIRVAAHQAAAAMVAVAGSASGRAFCAALLAAGGDINAAVSSLRSADEAQAAGTSSEAAGVVQVTGASSEAAGASSEAAGGAQATGASLEAAGGAQATGASSEAAGGAQATGASSEAAGGAQATGASSEADGGVQATGASSEADGGVQATGASSETDGGVLDTGTSSEADGGAQATRDSSEADRGAQATGASSEADRGAQATGASSEADGGAQVASESSAESAYSAQVADKVALKETGKAQSCLVLPEIGSVESVNPPSADASNEIQAIVGEIASLQTSEQSSTSSPVAIQASAGRKKSKGSQSEEELKDKAAEKQTTIKSRQKHITTEL